MQTPFDERNGIVSPDGHWLAYEANGTGAFEIYVRPFPDVTRGRWQVSTSGGTQPLWARSGQELFYFAPDGTLMRVVVAGAPAWKFTEGRQPGAAESRCPLFYGLVFIPETTVPSYSRNSASISRLPRSTRRIRTLSPSTR